MAKYATATDGEVACAQTLLPYMPTITYTAPAPIRPRAPSRVTARGWTLNVEIYAAMTVKMKAQSPPGPKSILTILRPGRDLTSIASSLRYRATGCLEYAPQFLPERVAAPPLLLDHGAHALVEQSVLSGRERC